MHTAWTLYTLFPVSTTIKVAITSSILQKRKQSSVARYVSEEGQNKSQRGLLVPKPRIFLHHTKWPSDPRDVGSEINLMGGQNLSSTGWRKVNISCLCRWRLLLLGVPKESYIKTILVINIIEDEQSVYYIFPLNIITCPKWRERFF